MNIKAIKFFTTAISIIFFSLTANAQFDTLTNKISTTMQLVIPKIDKDFETFDFQKFDSTKEKNSFTLKDGTYNEYQKQSYGFIMRSSPPDSYFRIIKKFYQNGNIKEKGLSVNNGGFKKGTWYYFDETGKLINQENTDTLFNFSFTDLLYFLEKEKIPTSLGYDAYGFNTSIYNEIDADGVRWIVKWLKDTNSIPNVMEKITINGEDGKIIKRESFQFVNN